MRITSNGQVIIPQLVAQLRGAGNFGMSTDDIIALMRRPPLAARRSPLPDFYIGAHAAFAGLKLLTRDARRDKSYFPSVSFLAP